MFIPHPKVCESHFLTPPSPPPPSKSVQKSPKDNQTIFFFFCPFLLLFYWYWCYYLHTVRESMSPVCVIFKASALCVDDFYKSKCPYVCLCVCLFVRQTFSLLLTVFLSPLPEVQCPNFLNIQNPWGKVMERSDLR